MSTDDVDKKNVAEASPALAAPSENEASRAEPTTAPPTAAVSTPFVPPDGGRKAWLAVAGGFLCQFCSFGFVNACVVPSLSSLIILDILDTDTSHTMLSQVEESMLTLHS